MKSVDAAADLVAFIEDGTTPSSLVDVVEVLGVRNTRVIVFKILSWLGWRWRSGRDVSLGLRQEYRWCNDLAVLLERSPEMGEFFQLGPRKFSFRESVPADDRTAVVNYVHEHYKPTLHVHRTLEAWKKYLADREAEEVPPEQ